MQEDIDNDVLSEQELNDEQWDIFFEQLLEEEKQWKEEFQQEVGNYLNHASEYIENAEDPEDVDEYFDISMYDYIRALGFAKVKLKETQKEEYVIDSTIGFDSAKHFDLMHKTFHKQKFLSDKNPNMLICQWTDSYTEDCYKGYMLFPIPYTSEYWCVAYSC